MSDSLRLGDPRSEEKLGFLLVKEKVITESQLKTALDFQRAIGGTIDEVIVRLQFVDRAIMKRVLSKLGVDRSASGSMPDDAGPTEPPLSESEPPSNREPDVSEEDRAALEEAFGDILHGSAEHGDPTGEGSHTGIILDALLRILIRKEIVGGDEIKEELRKLEAEQA